MHIILLSGGSGKRLWPLSNDIRSKQFIKIFKTADGGYESMFQKTYRQIKNINTDAGIIIAASKRQESTIRSQIGIKADISFEPYRRDTFPAIALTTAYLVERKGIRKDEIVIVCPVDSCVDEDYFKTLQDLSAYADTCEANIVLLGIKPTYPSEKYGYIIPDGCQKISKVAAFKEKPDTVMADSYINQGALWNAGVFAFKPEYILKVAKEQLGFMHYDELLSNYEELAPVSFDHAVVEKESNIHVMRFDGKWKDLGTWNTLTEEMDENSIGIVHMADNCKNTHIINELDVPVLSMGVQDVIISASPEGILVSDKEQSSYIKPFVENIHQQIMFAEKSWGSFRVLDIEDESLTIKVTLHPGQSMNYHSHDRRDEIWNIISGRGQVMLNNNKISVKAGDIIEMKAGCCHTITADTELKLIEVQIGKDISVQDKHKYPL